MLAAKSSHPIDVRCEVRYCLSGVGVGVEFIGMSPADQDAMASETRTLGMPFKLQRPAPTKKRRTTRRTTRRKKP